MDPVSVSIIVSVPREEVFDYLQDIANHAEFTDHFLVDWNLTRMDPVGRGAGARFRVKAPANRFSWADVTFVEVDRPHRIVEIGRTGKNNRIRTLGVYELAEAAGGTRVTFTFRTEPATFSDRISESSRRAFVDQTQERPRAPAPAGDPRGRGRAGAASDRCRWLDSRLACDSAPAGQLWRRSAWWPCSP